jgi:DNA polymerase III subunit alpha
VHSKFFNPKSQFSNLKMLLNCHTYYSFCYGTLSTKRLLTEVYNNGYTTFALTDINNTSAVLDTLRLTQGKPIKPVIGIDFRNGVHQQYIGLAQNNEGYKELNEHLSKHLHASEDFQAIAPAFNHAYIIYPLVGYKGWALQPNEFIGVSINDLRQLPFSPYKNLVQKLVALHQVSFAEKIHYNMHRLLRAIDSNVLLSKLDVHQQAKGAEIMMPKEALLAAYANYPFIISNTENLLANCTVQFDFGKLSNKNLQFYNDNLVNDIALLRSECLKGLSYRYPNPTAYKEAFTRMEKELEVIGKMQFSSYFLINWDITQYAQHKNYYHVGRGSGANSIVAYLLGITDVDPIELDLYFERFINEFRSNAPDFDIDFSWTDRDDMTRYIFERFGKRGNTALLGAYNTFQQDAIVRQLGKVYGLPPGEIDRLQKPERYKDIDEMGQQVLRYSERLLHFPSHLSIHSSGIIISEEPITQYSATYLPPKGYPTTQFSMLEAEDIGLYKFDILSQRGLGKIKDALTIIKQNKNITIDIHDIKKFTSDETVKTLLREGKAIGCFYVESPGMRMLLAKLRADDYLRLVAASSIIRPGVAKSGMMRQYIMRYRDETLRAKAREQLPQLYDILAETYGVMVYQEDVIKVAHLFADLTLAEADYLRRGMSWKFKQRNEFARVRGNFFKNCLAKGHEESVISEIWNQIESFGNFAFAKGHSASYAVESYQALYLKAHFPLEYMVATLNNGGGFYRTELYVHEARMHGATIHLPCINNSNNETVIKDSTIFLGLGSIGELNEHARLLVLQERALNGNFNSLEDFVERVPLSIEQLRLLVRVGAFAFTGKGKKELLWQAHVLVHPIKQQPGQSLFKTKPKTYKLPALHDSVIEDAFDEIDLLGFPLSSPFSLLRSSIPSQLTAKDLPHYINQTVTIVGYLVHTKRTQTSKGERMYFGTFVDTEGFWIDTVHFPDSAKRFPFTGGGCYRLTGKVTVEYDFMSIEVESMKRLPMVDMESLQQPEMENA